MAFHLTIKSVKEQGILQRLVVAVFFMMVIPLLLCMYLLYTEAEVLLQKTSVQMIIFFMICSALSGYILSRGIIVAILELTKEAQSVVQGDFKKRIQPAQKNEINKLAQYFNQITNQLEDNIAQLQDSKQLMQNVLLRIGGAMTSTEEIENILGLTIETLCGALYATSGAIMMLEQDKLRVMTASGIPPEQYKNLEIKKGVGVIGWVAREKKAQNVSRSQGDRRFDEEVKMGLAHKSIICAPMIYKETLIGVISLHDRKVEDEFSEDNLFLLENLATQTAIAIENKRLNEDAERTYVETISALALAIEAKDVYSRGHSGRVREYVTKMAEAFKLDKETVNTLKDAALLHDIGKIGIRDDVLLKPASLTPEEKAHMDRHVVIGETILKPIHSMNNVAYLVRHHQERVNGKGYPDGLTGEQMSLPLKILIIADAYDAMTSDRPYRKAMTKEEAKQELKRYSGVYFDPAAVEMFAKEI
ncbi:MAG: HD domain-containing phosphohydrolase [Candidatus Omnitrophota bacterium]